MDRIYLDINLLLYALCSKDKPDLTEKARHVINFIKEGVFLGIVSELVLLELISGLRKSIFRGRTEYLTINEIQRNVSAIIFLIFQILNLILFRSSQTFAEIEKEASSLMEKYPGQVINGKYKFIHPLDVLHIILAKEAGCTAIYTNDIAYEQLKSEIPIQILQRERKQRK